MKGRTGKILSFFASRRRDYFFVFHSLMRGRKNIKKYAYSGGLIFLFAIVLSSTVYFQDRRSHESASSVEVGFFSLSPNGSLGGEILPASCESGTIHEMSGCDMTFWADSTSLPYGGSTSLHWYVPTGNVNAYVGVMNSHPGYPDGLEIGHIQSCVASGDWSGDQNARPYPETYSYWSTIGGGYHFYARQSDPGTGSLTSTKTYNLTCTINYPASGGQDVVTKSVTVNVAPHPPAAAISAVPNTIPWNSASLLILDSQYSTRCGLGYYDYSGVWNNSSITPNTTIYQSTGPLTANRTYYFTCDNGTQSNPGGWQPVAITVDPAPTSSISVSPPNPVPNGANPSFTLNTNATASICYVRHIFPNGVWDSWGVDNATPGAPGGTYYPGPQTYSGTHYAASYCYNSLWKGPTVWTYTGFTVDPAPTVSVSILQNPPVPYGSNPGFKLESQNTAGGTCYIQVDGAYLTDGTDIYLPTSGTFYHGAFTSPGTHNYRAFCYNSVGYGTGWTPPAPTNYYYFTVDPAPTASISPNVTIPYGSSTTLTLSNTNSSTCYLYSTATGWDYTNRAGTTSYNTSPLTATTSYTYHCTNGYVWSDNYLGANNPGYPWATVTVEPPLQLCRNIGGTYQKIATQGGTAGFELLVHGEESAILRTYLNNANNCSGRDITDQTIFVEKNNPQDVIRVTGSNPKIVEATLDILPPKKQSGTERIVVSYNGQEVSRDINVDVAVVENCVWDCSLTEKDHCSVDANNEKLKYKVTDSCDIEQSCDGKRYCDYNYKEVSP
ncbi:MAG: hypothetical protein Q7S04_00095 [Candidatus Moranbacteria bacterium]|nr:hypothetical protein [Candidatus Moranbacteria bacterium]